MRKPNYSLSVAISYCLELLLLQHYIAVFGHIWAGGFQSKDKAMVKETKDSNCRQADGYMKKCDSYQAVNRKWKKNSKGLKKPCMEEKMKK